MPGASVKKNYDIEDYLCSLNHYFSIYGFTETWFKESPPSYIHKNNYQLVHSSRSNKLGGGVTMFISDSLNFCIRDDLMCSCEDFECIFIEIQHEHGCTCNLIIGNVYRAPSTSVENFNKLFGDCLNFIAKE